MSSFLARPSAAIATAFCSLCLACSGTEEPAPAGQAGSGGTTNVSSGGQFAGSGGELATGTGGSSSGGLMNGAGGAATGGAPIIPDCSGIADAGFELCESTDERCGAVFTDGSGCSALCAAAGLICQTGLENVDGMCASDDTLPAIACDTGHQSDYCVCVTDPSGGGTGGAGAGGTGGETTGGAGTGGAGTGGTGSGGTGTGGTPAVSWTATGFASVASLGVTTTTGGGNVAPTTVSNCDEMVAALTGDTPRVVRIAEGAQIDCRTNGTVNACELQCSSSSSMPVFWRVPVGDQTCTTLADFNGDGSLEVPAGKLVSRPARDRGIGIGSNKTLYGAGDGATILGASFSIQDKQNIIIRNLVLTDVNPSLIEAGDGISVNGSHHVWIDHCELSLISDGYVDIRYGSSKVTFSNNHIKGANPYICSGQHNFVSLVDDADGVTYNHNYFDHPGGRNPKVGTASKVHLYSNYYEGVSYFCANAGGGAQLLVQGNSYHNSNRPHWRETNGQVEASGNVYTGTTSANYRDSGDNVFDPPYTYSLDSAAELSTSIPANAGPGLGL